MMKQESQSTGFGAVNVRRVLVGLILTALALSLPSQAMAYGEYEEGCNTCHGPFYTSAKYQSPNGGALWPASVHDVHRQAAYMGTECGMCHGSGGFFTWKSYGAAGLTGYGCSGCHGQIVKGVPKGFGLRARHLWAGDKVCLDCHKDDGAPAPESTLPYYYGHSVTKAKSSCNDDAPVFSEDFSGNGQGLDNDGDGVYDLADPDCNPCPDADEDGWWDIDCNDNPLEGGGDCDDDDPLINPDAQDVCDGIDQDCDGVKDNDGDASCWDGVGCTDDACADGDCVNLAMDILCDDDVECTVDTCTDSGCVSLEENASCDDQIPCTVDTCTKQGCLFVQDNVLCDDGLDCTVDECGDAGCTSVSDDGLCNDGIGCTADSCGAAGCEFEPDDLGCDDADPCTADSCDPDTGCGSGPAPDGTSCDDADPCTGDDKCVAGACVGLTPVCGDCLSDADCAQFDDGNPCNGVLVCAAQDGGQFLCETNQATVAVCSSEGMPPCLENKCDPDTGACAAVAKADELACDLGDVCVKKAGCVGGECKPQEFISCGDGNECTDDVCDPVDGCKNPFNSAPCDDQDPCTQFDHCLDGECSGAAIDGCCLSDDDCDDGECEAGLCKSTEMPEPEPDVVTQPEVIEPDASVGQEVAFGPEVAGAPDAEGEGGEDAAGPETENPTADLGPDPAVPEPCPPKSACTAASAGNPMAGLLFLALGFLLWALRFAWYREA